MHGSTAEQTDRTAIELICWWNPGFLAMFDKTVRIGDDMHPPFERDDIGRPEFADDGEEERGWNLYDCPIIVSVYAMDDEWAQSSEANGEAPNLGRLTYSAPFKSSDGVVSRDLPKVFAWFGLGRQSFEALRARMWATTAPDFEIGFSVEFPSDSVEAGWVDVAVDWDGKGALPVLDPAIVWKTGEWNSEVARPEHIKLNHNEHQEVLQREIDPSQAEIVRTLTAIKASIPRLITPLWLTFGAVILLMIGVAA
mgnify:FL=1